MAQISLITATFNSEKHINNCIKSVKMQEGIECERIYIDGDSKDNTLKIIQKNETLKYTLISEKDKGIYNALNKGISISNGEIIGFLHSDDVLASSKILQKIYKTILEENLDGIYGNLNYG